MNKKIEILSKQFKLWDECIYYRPVFYNEHRCSITDNFCKVLTGELCPYLTVTTPILFTDKPNKNNTICTKEVAKIFIKEKNEKLDLLYEYWNKTELGKRMIKSNNISDSDLLFLIPNNVKKIKGLPLTRISGKKKKKQKKQRKRHIMSFQCFDVIEEIVDELIVSKFSINEFFNEFTEIKNFNFGEKVIGEKVIKIK